MRSRLGALRRVVAGLLGAAALLCGLASAQAADPVGPALGNNKFRGSISDVEDADDFVGQLFPGDVLTITVAAAKKGKAPPTLMPLLSLIDPSGAVRTSGIVASPTGSVLTLKGFVVDMPGVWAARIAGANGTVGDFTVSFRIKARPKQVMKLQELGGSQPLSRVYEIPAFDGAVLDAVVTYSKESEPVELVALLDPDGNDVLDAAQAPVAGKAVRRKLTLSLKGAKLGPGSGTYQFRLGIPTAVARFTFSYSLKNPARPKSPRLVALSPLEPRLEAIGEPIIAQAGQTVTFTGTQFATKGKPKVRFGRAAATSVVVGAGGTSMEVVVPPRVDDAVVTVYVANPDGQGMGRDLYFGYIPAPVITDLVDATTGSQVRVSPATGGRSVRLLGANFEDTHTVRVGSTVIANPNFLTGSEIRFTLPARPDGDVALQVEDLYTRSATSDFQVRYKTAPAFAADPYSPGAVRLSTPTTVTISGTTFEDTDQLLFNGAQVPSTFVSATSRTFDVPSFTAGAYAVRLVDRIGTIVDGPVLYVKGPPTISSVTVVAGAVINTSEIPLAGGSTIRVDGTEFVPNDTVTLGGVTVTSFLTRTATRKEFLAPAGAAGFVSLTVLDGASQSATATNVLRYVGMAETTSNRLPSPGTADDYSAIHGAAADFDRDGRVDDLVIVSPLGNLPGTETRQTRLLIGNNSTLKLEDKTTSAIPAARTDPLAVDSWDATAVAIGDLDGANGPDIVIGGQVGGGGTYNQVRLFKNGGAGTFSLNTTSNPSSRYIAPVSGSYYKLYYYYTYTYTIYGQCDQKGTPQAIAIGDIDNDGDQDVVVGTNESQDRGVYIDPANVNFSTVPPTINKATQVSYRQYFPATRILINPAGGKLSDGSATRLPKAGTTKDVSNPPAAFLCRDLALVDINKDSRLDIVVTWDNPKSVTHYGKATGMDGPRVATRILLNSASSPGTFTDQTNSWMPGFIGNEFWQGDRVALGDLDNDGDSDLVLLCSKGLDAWTGTETHTARALRVLRNDLTRFVDVTAVAVPAPDQNRNDDWRGVALAVRDVDSDGRLDILVSTKDSISNKNGSVAPRLRFFRGNPGSAISFTLTPDFLVPVATDSGECDRIVTVNDLAGVGQPVMVLLSESKPLNAPATNRSSRSQEWKK